MKNHKRVISGDKRSPAMLEKRSMGAVERSGHPSHSSPVPDDTDNPFNPPENSKNQGQQFLKLPHHHKGNDMTRFKLLSNKSPNEFILLRRVKPL